jgi:hypothetical protein
MERKRGVSWGLRMSQDDQGVSLSFHPPEGWLEGEKALPLEEGNPFLYIIGSGAKLSLYNQ